MRILDSSLLIFVFLYTFTSIALSAEHTVRQGQSIQSVVNKASPGDTIKVMPGLYHETVFIDKNDIHLLGVVINGKWPVLDGKDILNDGVLAAGHGVTIEQLFVKRFKGNGIMTQGGNNFKIIRNRVEGYSIYGIFPQFGKNGLVAYNTISGIEDAAIYVGMCDNVDVLYNDTYGSVIGIESENSRNILLEGNYIHDNTTGVMLALLPGLPIKDAKHTIVRNNFIINNNFENFAPEGAIAAGIPRGTGVFAYAVDEFVIENNLIKNNDGIAIMVTDHTFLGATFDPKVDPRPDKNKILKNTFVNNGTNPGKDIAALSASLGIKGGIDIFATGKGRKNCINDGQSVRVLGVERWSECAVEETTAHIASLQLPKPYDSPELTMEQKGRLTYLAVCTGCHTYSQQLIGPPMMAIKAIYQGRTEALAAWIANPTKRNPALANMPPQDYLPEEIRLQVAKYILEELEQ
jgi:parallel beta-helix repeat protein